MLFRRFVPFALFIAASLLSAQQSAISGHLPDPQDLATEAITEFEAIVDDLREIVALVEKEEGVEK